MADYRLSPRARHDLETIWEYSFEQWGLEQANRYIDKIIAKFEAIASDPLLLPACDHIRSGYRRALAERHMIYFRVNTQAIIIMRVLHSQMDANQHL
jgi:toxin ParE1/3/4